MASDLGLTNIQGPCVMLMKKFGLYATGARKHGSWGSRVAWAVDTLERLHLSLGGK